MGDYRRVKTSNLPVGGWNPKQHTMYKTVDPEVLIKTEYVPNGGRGRGRLLWERCNEVN